jgi:hypothetical protein
MSMLGRSALRETTFLRFPEGGYRVAWKNMRFHRVDFLGGCTRRCVQSACMAIYALSWKQ